MNKKGFTLAELLVVIAIIAVISIIAIPSIITVNKNINKRLYASKIETIISQAELYGTDNEDIFNGKSEVKVYLYELIEKGYLTKEVDINGTNCTENITLDTGETVKNTEKGCVLNPINKESLNAEYVILKKEAIGITAEYNGQTLSSAGGILVEQVCDRFDSKVFVGKYGTADADLCACNSAHTGLVSLGGSKTAGTKVNACIIAGNEQNNYLKYDNVMWRVMGLYNIGDDSDIIVTKMITSDNVDVQ